MYGYGHNEAFVAWGRPITCEHCHNNGHEAIYAPYTYEMLMGIRKYTYGAIIIACHICRWGQMIKRDKLPDAKAMLHNIINVPSVKSYYDKLGYLEKRRYLKMLEQLRLHDLVITLKHGDA